ncbi:DUF5723 family protein [Adhaeribacter soli]|uniref:DUF5723 domain-containing protein n=1 Tax=Adhaeribacter soli TaxID=2607655 RepID=A0A5N1J2R3_9BACT|nr:DUF5723 family protein [Adhaeribacter soli]KAA9340812.1 hypothetical protein F0P94_05125 [Adhaeribacter soli]
MKKILLAGFLAVAAAGNVFAQNELSNFTATGRGGVVNTFATDYQAIGINPANLGRSGNALFSFSLFEVGAGINSKSLTRKQLNKFISNVDERLTQAEKQEFAKAFNNEDALNVNVDVSTLAIAFQIPKFGGIAVSNRQRVASHIGLNKNGADILFLGKNAPVFTGYQEGDTISIRKTLAPTSIQMSLLNEWNVAAGLTVLDLEAFKLQVGVGYKHIQGIGVLDIVIDQDQVTAYTALSPEFDVNYGDLVNDPNFNTADIGTGLFKPVGKGHAFDLGVSAEIGEKILASVAVTDIGNMTWRGNLLTANDQYITKVTSEGINSFNFFKEVANIAGGGSDSLFSYQPNKSLKTKTPGKLRTGFGFKFSDKVEAGIDATFPLNEVAGNLVNPFVGVGVDYKVLPLLKVSSGLTAGAGYGASVPLGLTFVTPVYELGVATRDIAGLIGQEDPYLSAAFGFLRFKFGTLD